jgi:hypothetical protein
VVSTHTVNPPTRPSIFGPIISGGDVEQWCLDLLRKWTSTYLAEKERQDGLTAGDLQRPRFYGVTVSFDQWPEAQLPSVLVISIGLAERPLQKGDGSYTGRWEMGVGCVCSARTEDEAHAMAMRYMAALRVLFLQRPSLEGHAAGVDWLGEQYDQLGFDESRSLAGGFGQFTVEVDGIALAKAGPVTPDVPLDPDTDPWADWPTVQSTDVQVERVDEITEGGTTT